MSDLAATALFYPARPSFTLDGNPEPNLDQGLVSLAVEETIEGLFRCEATFGNWGAYRGNVDFLYFDREVLEFGRRISIDMGSGETAGTIFEGRITAIEGRFPQTTPPEVLVLAEDRFQDLRMVRRSRAFEDVNDEDVMRQIASEHGLGTEIDVDGPTYRVLAQVNQSDLAFLRERARAIDAEVWIEGDTLHAQARSRRQEREITLTYGRRLRQFLVTADLANQRSSLAIGGWDVGAKERIEEESSESAIQSELNGGASGSSILDSAFGERPERIVHLTPLSVQEARALADAHYRRIARRFVCGHGEVEGDGRLRVGAQVRLSGLGPLFDGPYYVAHVRHTFDIACGFKTFIRVERPGLGAN